MQNIILQVRGSTYVKFYFSIYQVGICFPSSSAFLSSHFISFCPHLLLDFSAALYAVVFTDALIILAASTGPERLDPQPALVTPFLV